jgi:galactose mutarotase-like enzyme
MPLLRDREIDVVYVGARSPATLSDRLNTLDVEFDPLIDTVVVYTPLEAVCVEPWTSWPDAARLAVEGSRTGMVEIEPGQVFRRWTRWVWGSTTA